MAQLVIVESPTKAKKIGEFLGKSYDVQSSNGHVRDLPRSAMNIDIKNGFTPNYEIVERNAGTIADLKKRAKKADSILFATDEDREGEAISWHLAELFKIPTEKAQRIAFHEITKKAILEAIEHPRTIDQNMVKAQEARRLLDRLFGYEVSPLLWRKIRPGLSAGRVQSVAIRLIVEREKQRIAFVSASYWDIIATFITKKKESFQAQLAQVAGKRIAIGKDFDSTNGTLKNTGVACLGEKETELLMESLKKSTPVISALEEKPFTEKPLAPFTTSTLQQEANRKLRFSAKRTMRLAQNLYENGFITYMRTDSTLLSQQALSAARSWITKNYGKEYLPGEARQYQTKVKNAQEAHEAIRPAGESFTELEAVKSAVEEDAYHLYELIWKRTVASQMNDSSGTRLTARITLGDALFEAKGKSYSFEGYRRAYVEGSDDPESDLAEQESILPPLSEGDSLTVEKLEPKSHDTQPPARLTEAALVKELESRGIGRPSTYASIIDTIERRDYVEKKGTALIPTFTAFAVVNMLEKYLPEYVDYQFTAQMEDELDDIALGKLEDKEFLNEFYFGTKKEKGLKPILERVQEKIDPRSTSGVPIGIYKEKPVEVRIGKYGPFVRWNEKTAALQENVTPEDLTVEKAIEMIEKAVEGPKSLGVDPVGGKNIYVKVGRFGPYVQLGEQPHAEKESGEKQKGKKKPKGEKPKMVSLLPTMSPETITHEEALQLLSFPKELGLHPTTQQPITALLGRFGPYIKHGDDTRSVSAEFNILTLSLENALHLLAQEKTFSRRSARANALKELGEHPKSKKPIKVMNGKYGPYVTDGTTNASIPKDITTDEVTLEQAAALIDAREGAPKKPRRGKKKK